MQFKYLNKFQQGGSISITNQIASLISQVTQADESQSTQIANTFVKIAGGEQQAEVAIREMQQQGAQPKDVVNQIIQSVKQYMSQIQETDVFKCGGKTKKKKVKKGEEGLSMPKGTFKEWGTSKSYTKVGKLNSGGKGCKCKLARFGTKLINVDSCTGLPIQTYQLGKPIFNKITSFVKNKIFGNDEIKNSPELTPKLNSVKNLNYKPNPHEYHDFNDYEYDPNIGYDNFTGFRSPSGGKMLVSKYGEFSITPDNQIEREVNYGYKANMPNDTTFYIRNKGVSQEIDKKDPRFKFAEKEYYKQMNNTNSKYQSGGEIGFDQDILRTIGKQKYNESYNNIMSNPSYDYYKNKEQYNTLNNFIDFNAYNNMSDQEKVNYEASQMIGNNKNGYLTPDLNKLKFDNNIKDFLLKQKKFRLNNI